MSQTVSRALLLLNQIAEEPQSLGMLADRISVHKSTALRLAASLEEAGFVRRREDGKYVLGSGLFHLASKALETFDVRDIARPHLTRLNHMCGHTVHLASLISGDVIYVDKYEGNAPIRMYSRIGKSASLHASGVGKVILAFQEEDKRDELLADIDYQRHTENTLTNEDAFRGELETIREQNYAVDNREFEEIIHCIAAPVRKADGSVTSAVSISVPTMLITLDELMELLPDLTDAADATSRDYGWRQE